jgi:hypothetical protein
MGKLLAFMFSVAVAVCPQGAVCEKIAKSGASFGNNSFVLTLTADPPGMFLVFPVDEKEGAGDFNLRTFDPAKLTPRGLGSFFISISQRGFFDAVTLFSGERTSLGGNVVMRLNDSTLMAVYRNPQPLLVVVSGESVLAFLGRTLVMNESSPELAREIGQSLLSGGAEPYSFSSTGALVFRKVPVGSRIGIEESPGLCDSPEVTFYLKGEESNLDSANLIRLADKILWNVENSKAYLAESALEEKGVPRCSLSEIKEN